MAVERSDYSNSGTDRQVDGNHSIPLRQATIAAFIGRTKRGPANVAVRIESFDEYCRQFGGHCSFGFLSYAVQHYFQHGGQVAVIVRVANRAVRATLALPAGREILLLQAREPGSHCYLRAAVDYDGVGRSSKRFNLVVQRLARPGSELVEDQEIFRSVSLVDGDRRSVAVALTDSALVQVAGPLPSRRPDATEAAEPGEPIPYVEMSGGGSDGEELTDYDIIGSKDEGTGLFALDAAARVDLLCIPPAPSGRELGMMTFLAADRYCERRRAMLIWDAPSSWCSLEAALIGLRETGIASQNVLTYYPRARIDKRSGRVLGDIPASGVIAGLLSQNDRSGIWQPLAQGDWQVKAGLTPMEHLDDKQASILQRNGVNSLRRAESGAIQFWGNASLAGSRTVSGLWQRFDRRRLAFFILGSIERHTLWSLSRSRDAALWEELSEQVEAFLTGLFEHGALAGTHVRQAFSVAVGSDLHHGDDGVVIRIGFALDKPSDFQVYDIVHTVGGTETRAIAPLDAVQLVG